MIGRLFLAHPRSVDESYAEHARVAFGFGATMVGAGLACMVHGLIPALFTRTGSGAVRRLHARLSTRSAVAAQRPAPEWQLTWEI